MLEALTSMVKGNMDEAESKYREIVSKDKENGAAWYYLSNIRFDKQDIAGALDCGNRAVKASEDNIWYKVQLCEMYMAVQDYDNAAIVLEKIVAQEPQTLEYWQQLALIYHVKQDIKGEISVLDRMEERFGVNEISSMEKYRLFREEKDSVKAEKEIVKLSEAFPTQSKYYSILAEIKMKQKDYDKALYYYNKVKEADPLEENLNITFANYYLQTKQDDSAFVYLKKTVAQKNMDYLGKIRLVYAVYGDKVDSDEKTFERFFSLLETIRDYGEDNECGLNVLLNVGYMRKGLLPEALNAGMSAIENGCADYPVYQNVLFAMSDGSSPDSVVSVADKTIEKWPYEPLPYLFKAEAYKMEKKPELAIEALKAGADKAVKDSNMLLDFYVNLADCYYIVKDSKKAFEYYGKVLEADPDNVYVLNNYAYYLVLENKETDKALRMAERLISLKGDEDTFIDTYAWVLYVNGKYAEAKQAMEKIKKPRSEWDETFKKHYRKIVEKIGNR